MLARSRISLVAACITVISAYARLESALLTVSKFNELWEQGRPLTALPISLERRGLDGSLDVSGHSLYNLTGMLCSDQTAVKNFFGTTEHGSRFKVRVGEVDIAGSTSRETLFEHGDWQCGAPAPVLDHVEVVRSHPELPSVLLVKAFAAQGTVLNFETWRGVFVSQSSDTLGVMRRLQNAELFPSRVANSDVRTGGLSAYMQALASGAPFGLFFPGLALGNGAKEADSNATGAFGAFSALAGPPLARSVSSASLGALNTAGAAPLDDLRAGLGISSLGVSGGRAADTAATGLNTGGSALLRAVQPLRATLAGDAVERSATAALNVGLLSYSILGAALNGGGTGLSALALTAPSPNLPEEAEARDVQLATGVTLRYVKAGSGPVVVLSTPGGQDGMHRDPVPRQILMDGDPDWREKFTLVMYDRRNTGASSIRYAEDEAGVGESVLHARDILALLNALGIERAVLVGNSAGSRASLLFAREHPERVTALVLRNPTAGDLAARVLSSNYYEQYVFLVETGGMASLLNTAHYGSLVEKRASNRATLLNIDPAVFVRHMRTSAAALRRTSGGPILGWDSPEDVATVAAPALVVHCQVPDDGMHTVQAAASLAAALPAARPLVTGTYDDTYLSGWPKTVREFLTEIYAESRRV